MKTLKKEVSRVVFYMLNANESGSGIILWNSTTAIFSCQSYSYSSLWESLGSGWQILVWCLYFMMHLLLQCFKSLGSCPSVKLARYHLGYGTPITGLFLKLINS